MGSLAYNVAQLSAQNGALPAPARAAAAEILTAAEKAGHHVAAVSWFNPESTPEHHVAGFKGQGGVAVDFMVYGDEDVQDFIDSYAWKHRARLGLCWQISRQRIRSTSPGRSGNWEKYRGAAHRDHTHMNFGKLVGTSGYGRVSRVTYKPLIVTHLPAYVVDPAKVETTLTANAPAGKSDQQRPPGFRITTGVELVKDGDRTWLRTEAGYLYDAAYLILESQLPKPVVDPTTVKAPPKIVRAPDGYDYPGLELVAELDAPGSGNWQGAAQNADSGEWFLFHAWKQPDGSEDVHVNRFGKDRKWADSMVLKDCTHPTGFGVSDTNVLWLTWNGPDGNDVVTLDYKAGSSPRKADTQQMHVFTDSNAQVSFSPSRDWLVVREVGKSTESYVRRRKQDVLDNVDRISGERCTVDRSDSRVVQGFTCVNQFVYVLIGLKPKSAFRIEKWDTATGKLVATLKLSDTLGLRPDEPQDAKVEPEGMDGRTFGMKVMEGADRRLRIFRFADFT